MRMVGPDFALFIVGALLFGGATYGLIVTQSDDSSGTQYDVKWATQELAASPQTFTEPTPVDVTGDATNVTNIAKVAFTVTCNDANSARQTAPYTLTVTFPALPAGVAKPEDARVPCNGQAQEIVVFSGNATPKDRQVAAGSAEAALRDPTLENSTAGRGEYQAQVTGARGGNVPAQVVGNLGRASATIEFKVTYHKASATASAPVAK